MPARKSSAWKKIMGVRASLSDGFTYPYGRFKFNKNTRSPGICRQIRNDKRAIKMREQEELRDVLQESIEDSETEAPK